LLIAGAVSGTGVSTNGSFASSDARDISLEGLGMLSGSISASYTERLSFGGSVTYPSLNQVITFSGAYDAGYETAPTLAAIAGTYTGRAGNIRGSDPGTLTVSTTGALSGGGSSGCKLTGSVVPRAKGNVYKATINFGGSPCFLANTTLTGVAYFEAPTKRLYAVLMTSARNDGMIFAGAKP